MRSYDVIICQYMSYDVICGLSMASRTAEYYGILFGCLMIFDDTSS